MDTFLKETLEIKYYQIKKIIPIVKLNKYKSIYKTLI